MVETLPQFASMLKLMLSVTAALKQRGDQAAIERRGQAGVLVDRVALAAHHRGVVNDRVIWIAGSALGGATPVPSGVACKQIRVVDVRSCTVPTGHPW